MGLLSPKHGGRLGDLSFLNKRRPKTKISLQKIVFLRCTFEVKNIFVEIVLQIINHGHLCGYQAVILTKEIRPKLIFIII